MKNTKDTIEWVAVIILLLLLATLSKQMWNIEEALDNFHVNITTETVVVEEEDIERNAEDTMKEYLEQQHEEKLMIKWRELTEELEEIAEELPTCPLLTICIPPTDNEVSN